jgi:hypothetical protein
LEKQFSDDGCAFAGQSGGQASGIPIDSPAPDCAPLEEGGYYRIAFLNSDDPRDGSEFMTLLHHSGYWISPNDGDMGPIRVALAEYKVVGKVD